MYMSPFMLRSLVQLFASQPNPKPSLPCCSVSASASSAICTTDSRTPCRLKTFVPPQVSSPGDQQSDRKSSRHSKPHLRRLPAAAQVASHRGR